MKKDVILFGFFYKLRQFRNIFNLYLEIREIAGLFIWQLTKPNKLIKDVIIKMGIFKTFLSAFVVIFWHLPKVVALHE